MNFTQLLGQKIRDLRIEKGWNQEALAFEAHINKNYLSDLERGMRNPSLLILKRICRALGVTLSELFIGID
ncbi:MAG TPA: helix-turn-helix transcriptional regulator [Bacilli bacterium]|nr:helix-turn-helix transcriptional regulator [Bacilli bacterium]HPS18674.1 helix-turn-helix transcriptional regulator [Bacilli bacterium]